MQAGHAELVAIAGRCTACSLDAAARQRSAQSPHGARSRAVRDPGRGGNPLRSSVFPSPRVSRLNTGWLTHEAAQSHAQPCIPFRNRRVDVFEKGAWMYASDRIGRTSVPARHRGITSSCDLEASAMPRENGALPRARVRPHAFALTATFFACATADERRGTRREPDKDTMTRWTGCSPDAGKPSAI